MNRKKKNWQQLFAEMQQKDSRQQNIGSNQRKSQTTYDQDEDGKIDNAWLYSQAKNIVNVLMNPASAWDNQSFWARKPYDHISNVIGSIIEPLETITNDKTELNPFANKFTPKDQRDKWYQNWIETDPLSQEKINTISMARSGAASYLDLVQVLGSGFMDSVETVIDTPAYGVSTAAGLFSKDAQKAVDQFIAKDLLQSDAFGYGTALDTTGIAAPLIKALVPNEEVLEENSIIGDKTEGLLESGVQLAETYGLNLLGVPADVTQAVFAFGSEAESALQNGAGHWEAGGSAAISAAGAVLTEMIFKGSLLDDLMGNKGLIDLGAITSKISNKVVKSLADYGIDATAEGLEEVVDNFISSLGSLLYEAESPEEIIAVLKDKNSFNNIFTAFAGGFAMSAIGNTGKVINSAATNTDYRTGLTAGEQSVFDKAFEQAMKDAEAETGKKPTGKEKTKLYGQTMDQLQKGYISTDTIGEVMDTKTYTNTNYKNVSNQISQLQPEYDELYNMKTGEKTDAQIDRQTEIKEQLDSLKQQRTELDNKLAALAKGTKLEESYKERTRRSQAFQAEPAQYENEYARQTVQNIVDSGVVNNTNRTHELVDLLAKVSADRSIVFSATDAKKLKETGFAIGDATVNGYYTENGIAINVNSPRALNTVVGHEITHALEGSEFYDSLKDVAISFAKNKGDYNSRMAALIKMYTGKQGYETDFDAKMEKELVADLIGEYVFNDADFVRSLSTQDQKLFQKIYEEIKYLCKAATAGSKEARQLEKVKKIFAEAYRDTKNTDQQPDGVKYSLSSAEINAVQKIGRKSVNQFSSREIQTTERFARQYWKEMGVKSPFFRAWFGDWRINDQTPVRIATQKEDVRGVQNNTDTGWNIQVSGQVFNETRRHTNSYNIAAQPYLPYINDIVRKAILLDSYGMDSNKPKSINSLLMHSLYAVADIGNGPEILKLYVEEMNDPNTDNTKKRAYQLQNIEKYQLQNGSSQIPVSSISSATGNINTIADLFAVVKRLDSSFKPKPASKVVNSDGTPMVVYHGTSDVFTEFKHSELSSREGSFFFAQNRDDAEAYSGNGRVMEVYVNIQNPIDYNDMPSEIYKLPDKKSQVNALRKMGYDGWVCDMDTGWGEISAFNSNQIKSATDNIGAFDGSNTDIRFSLSANDTTKHGDNVYGKDVALEESVVDADEQAVSEQTQFDETLPADDPAADAVNREQLERILGGKGSYTSENAGALYEELRNLKKGVRASNRLSYLLDHFSKDEWGSIRTALLNIRDNPNETVNPNSRAEAIARELLGREYEDSLEELQEMELAAHKPEEIRTAKDRFMAQIYNLEVQLATTKNNKQQSLDDFNAEIAELEELYNSKTKKTTKVAQDIQSRIARTIRRRDNIDASYARNIARLQESLARKLTDEAKTANQRQFMQENYFAWAENLVGDTSTWKDKKTGWGYMTNTLRRNLRAIVKNANGKPDYEKADAIYEALQGDYNRHEAEMNRELTRLREKYANLKITKAEDAYIQMLGEYRSNPSTTLTEDVIKEYYEKHKKHIDSQKVDQIIEMARQDYDDLIQRVNAVLKEQGMKEIPYRKGYFPHFTLDKQGPLAKLLNWKTRNDDIPTDIAGMTEQFEPVRSYQSFNKQRKTDITDYSFTKGFDAYSFGAMDWIYHIEDIQKRRALENYIRYVHSDEGVKQKIDAIKADEDYDADEAQEQIDLIYKEARNPLNNFVIDLRRGTQTLAGKKSSLDREMEYDTNRKIYSTMTNISNRVSANMVGGSVSAALTNFIPITQSWATVSPLRSMQAMAQTMRSAIRDDGMVDQSAFLTNRLRAAENLNKTGWDKASDKISILMTAIDNFTSQTVWRSKYDANMSEGMSEAEAIRDADNFAESVLAGRSRGSMPTIFDSKNPIIKTMTAFQLEVANQYGYLFKDVPQEEKNKNIARLTMKYAEVFVGAYAYNSLLKAMTGRTAAFDPIRIIQELLQDIFPSDDDEEEEEKSWAEIAGNFAENVLQEVPFVGGLLGGGRVPISSALPYDGLLDAFTGTIKDIENWDDGGKENLTKEWLNPVAYALMPMGGGQLKKTFEGLGMYLGNKPVAGSYTTSGDLRFSVEPTPGNVAQAALFGQWANENAQEYIDQGRKPLSQKQTEEFVELDIPIQQYWDVRDNLNRIDKSDSKTKQADKVDFINSLDLTVEQKNILVNNILDRKENVDMTDYDKFGSFAEFDFSIKNPEKYAFLKQNNISYADYAHDKDAYNWAYENPGKYALSKAFLINYTQYNTYRKNIAAIESGKDQYGQTISNSQRQRRIAYINSLPITKLEKAILIKQFYPSYTDADQMISMYINSSQVLSPTDKYIVLYELGLHTSWNGGGSQ